MKLLAFSGRKGSGKDTLAAFLIRNRGELLGASSHVHDAFANPIKEHLRDLFGVPAAALWGDDAAKNTLTCVRWWDLPHSQSLDDVSGPKSCLTARELMQHWGTEIVRRMNPNAWVNAMRQRVARAQVAGCQLYLVTDLRFPNELEMVQSLGGKVVRLTRNGDAPATHESETALDHGNFDWSRFDAILGNASLTIEQQNADLVTALRKWGWVHGSCKMVTADN